MTVSLDHAITESLRLVPLSTADNLLGFEIDLDQALKREGAFTHVNVERSSDPRCKLITYGTTAKTNFEELRAILLYLWHDWLSYDHFEAHDLTRTANSIRFRFVTRSGDSADDLCVTGAIVITGTFSLPKPGTYGQ
jgi:hypothetical protein